MSKILKASKICVGTPLEINNCILFNEKKKSTELCKKENKINDKDYLYADKKAKEIIKNAYKEAKEIIEDAQYQIEQDKTKIYNEAKHAAYNKGYKEGYDEGLNKGHIEILNKQQSLIKDAEDIKKLAQAEYINLINSSEEDIIKIIFEAINKIFGHYLKIEPEFTSAIIKEVLSKFKVFDNIIIKVSETDYDIIKNNKTKILKESAYKGELIIEKDITLLKGDCIIDTPTGIFDIGIKTQIESMKKSFYNILNQGKE